MRFLKSFRVMPACFKMEEKVPAGTAASGCLTITVRVESPTLRNFEMAAALRDFREACSTQDR